MAIAKKYRRKIVVDGLTYFWVVKDNLDIVNLMVELAESQGAKLRISFDYVRMYCDAEKQSIRPSFVRKAILDARAGGWRPELPDRRTLGRDLRIERSGQAAFQVAPVPAGQAGAAWARND